MNGIPLRSPSPSENLASHPYFRAEFALPDDPLYDEMISRRRMRASVSSASPAPSLYQEKAPAPTRSSKRAKKSRNMAGLVGGDSDSSALTQESGDESVAPTPATGTDGATEYADGDGDHEQSPGMGGYIPCNHSSDFTTCRSILYESSAKRHEGWSTQ